jgi:polysaccharide export outer membrane protein
MLLLAAAPLVALAQAAPTATTTAGAPREYRIGAGDVLRIVVFQSNDLTLETRVTEGGVVSYPLPPAAPTSARPGSSSKR